MRGRKEWEQDTAAEGEAGRSSRAPWWVRDGAAGLVGLPPGERWERKEGIFQLWLSTEPEDGPEPKFLRENKTSKVNPEKFIQGGTQIMEGLGRGFREKKFLEMSEREGSGLDKYKNRGQKSQPLVA